MTSQADRTTTRLAHIIEAIDRLMAYTDGMDEAAFVANRLVVDAVGLNIAIIGEAARVIIEHDVAFAGSHPELSLRQARAIRNVVIHAYAVADQHVVWRVVKDELPAMGAHARHALHEIEGLDQP